LRSLVLHVFGGLYMLRDETSHACAHGTVINMAALPCSLPNVQVSTLHVSPGVLRANPFMLPLNLADRAVRAA
jgi:hypothetical protein